MKAILVEEFKRRPQVKERGPFDALGKSVSRPARVIGDRTRQCDES